MSANRPASLRQRILREWRLSVSMLIMRYARVRSGSGPFSTRHPRRFLSKVSTVAICLSIRPRRSFLGSPKRPGLETLARTPLGGACRPLRRDRPGSAGGQEPVDQRVTCRLADGREVTVLASQLQLRHANGRPYAICGILRDITDLVAAQQEFERLGSTRPIRSAWRGSMGILNSEPRLVSATGLDRR